MAKQNESAAEKTRNTEILAFLDARIEKLMHLCNDDGLGNSGTTLATASLIQARALHLAYMKSII